MSTSKKYIQAVENIHKKLMTFELPKKIGLLVNTFGSILFIAYYGRIINWKNVPSKKIVFTKGFSKNISFLFINIIVVLNICFSSLLAQSLEKHNIQECFPNDVSLVDKIYTYSTIWNEIKYNFVNIDQITFNSDSLYNATIHSIIESTNDVDYYKILRRFICSFGDGHTALLRTSYDMDDYFDYIPNNIEVFDNKFYFTSIRKIDDADSTLLGAEIIEIESIPTMQYVKEQYFPYISASTYNYRLMKATSQMGDGIKGTFFKGKAKKTNGEIVSFSIERNGDVTYTENNKYWEIKRPPLQRGRIYLRWEENIAILTVNSFHESVMMRIDSLMQIVNSKAQGLIIDLRKNGGGSTEVAHHLQKYLTKENYFLSFGSQTRVNNAYGRSQGNYRKEYEAYYLGKAYQTEMPDTIFVERAIKKIPCPVVILIGKFSLSACEDFLVNIYETSNRPLLIGEETGGSTGAPLVIFGLPNKTVVRICTLRILYPYSLKPFVNKGISPDIEIKETFDDYLTGKDKVLERALKTFL